MFFDFPILYFIQDNLINPFCNWLMPVLSFVGEGGIIWICTAVVLMFFKKYRACSIIMIAAMLAGFFIGELALKNIIGRVRPCYVDLTVNMLVERPVSYSFPSGHSCSSFAAAGVMTLYDKRIGIPALILAGAIAFSRLYVFVHYPSDVIAGIALGISCAFAAYFLYKKFIDNKAGTAQNKGG